MNITLFVGQYDQKGVGPLRKKLVKKGSDPLENQTAHPSRIARDTGYSQKNIQDTLVDMGASGIVSSGQLVGRKKMYFVSTKYHHPFLYKSDPPPCGLVGGHCSAA